MLFGCFLWKGGKLASCTLALVVERDLYQYVPREDYDDSLEKGLQQRTDRCVGPAGGRVHIHPFELSASTGSTRGPCFSAVDMTNLKRPTRSSNYSLHHSGRYFEVKRLIFGTKSVLFELKKDTEEAHCSRKDEATGSGCQPYGFGKYHHTAGK